ncbi:unnamed protein product [Cuscuta epithymum]|uniref:histone deacetylase n=1 Tax=Cuscuta epithymum TaxID=186058 RepID=A0AAV0C8E9_9ASTE|nr:unnamed protein product [Cuscuta epithymum]
MNLRSSAKATRYEQKANDRTTCQKAVGLVYNDIMMKHIGPKGHWEKPERIKAIWQHLKKNRLDSRLQHLPCLEALEEWIERVHSQQYFQEVMKCEVSNRERKNILEKYNNVDSHDMYLSRGSREAMLNAAGGVVTAVQEVANRTVQSAFAVVRPPGHHASREKAEGFCWLNNMAIGATFLLDVKKYNKILKVDWDHQGNGIRAYSRVIPEFYISQSIDMGRVRSLFTPGQEILRKQAAEMNWGIPSMFRSWAGLGFNIITHCQTI